MQPCVTIGKNEMENQQAALKVYWFSFLFILFILLATVSSLSAQITRRVLFLGNSYTAVNNLPQLVKDVALSAGDTLVFDSNTPGGYQLADHSIDVTSKSKIMAGGWQYVIMQGQSQEPIMMYNQFTSGGIALYDLVRQYNSCAVPLLYMTWGRKNGDAVNCPSFPLMCTYQGMDTTIRDRYLSLASVIKVEVSPVSVLWNYLRQNYPGIELYQTDESHPSLAGSYAAACCFYAAIFKKDPSLITYDAGLSAADASVIRNSAKSKVFSNLQLWDFKKLPVSNFSYNIGTGTNEIILSPASQGAKQTYLWSFGDGSNSTATNVVHSYSANGTYTVSLTTANCDLQGMHTSFSDTVVQFCAHTPGIYTKNTWLCEYDTLWTQPADAYQWAFYGVLLPEFNRYLANYQQYNISGFSVFSTLNGCTERSQAFAKTPEWSGYYFDAVGDPCKGDSVAFAVLSSNGPLSGTEKILWYKNGALLPAMNNSDTLIIFSSGKYQCRVVNPNSNCPFDTTRSSEVVYDCGGLEVSERAQLPVLTWRVFPNPASEIIMIRSPALLMQGGIEIFNFLGQLQKAVELSAKLTYDIGELPNGLYFIRCKDQNMPPLKFMKE